jgi:hypothetical protein
LLAAGLFAFVDTLLAKTESPLKTPRLRPNKTSEGPPGAGKDPKTGRFVTGNSGGGRKLGTRRDLELALVDAVVRDFAEHGETTIERVRQEDPATYMRIAAGLLPKDVNVNVRSDLGIDSLVQRVRELAARGAGRAEAPVARIPQIIDQEPTNGVGDSVRLPARKTSPGDH